MANLFIKWSCRAEMNDVSISHNEDSSIYRQGVLHSFGIINSQRSEIWLVMKGV
jgi:hypothetical protein